MFWRVNSAKYPVVVIMIRVLKSLFLILRSSRKFFKKQLRMLATNCVKTFPRAKRKVLITRSSIIKTYLSYNFNLSTKTVGYDINEHLLF